MIETKRFQIVPISAAVAKQLDSGSYLEIAAFLHVCMNVPEVPGGTCTSSVRMARLGICEFQQVKVEILSLFYPLVVPIVSQYLFRPKAFFSIWRHVKLSRLRVITSPSVQHGGSSRVGCPRLLVPYIRSCLPHLEVLPSICNLRTRHAGSWTLKEEHKPRLFKNTSRVLTKIFGAYLLNYSMEQSPS